MPFRFQNTCVYDDLGYYMCSFNGGSLNIQGASCITGTSETLIAPASEEGANAIKTFTFDEGLKCELWAAEPMLANPVCFTEDEKGRWYVAETFRQNRGVVDIRGHGTWLNDDIASAEYSFCNATEQLQL